MQKWLYSTHDPKDWTDFNNTILGNNKVWLKQEPFIIHICCKDIESASKLITICRLAGLKRSGVVSISGRIIVEIIGSDTIETLYYDGSHILFTEKGKKTIFDICNRKLNKNFNRIKLLKEKIKVLFE